MRPLGTNAVRRDRVTLICSALAILFVMPDAQGQTSRHRKRTAFSVALQPFSLVHSAVHAVAAPVADKAPRILRAAATAPIRAVYYKQRRVIPRLPRAGRADYDWEDKPDGGARPIRVAYLARRMSATEPQAESEDEYDQEQGQENDGKADAQIERRGDGPTVAGKRAVLRNGIAYAPSRAPQDVKNAIWAANTLRRKPYVWGGGHGSFEDYGYDCSGTVSYALHHAGVLGTAMGSSEFLRYGERGWGRWVMIYAGQGHTLVV